MDPKLNLELLAEEIQKILLNPDFNLDNIKQTTVSTFNIIRDALKPKLVKEFWSNYKNEYEKTYDLDLGFSIEPKYPRIRMSCCVINDIVCFYNSAGYDFMGCFYQGAASIRIGDNRALFATANKDGLMIGFFINLTENITLGIQVRNFTEIDPFCDVHTKAPSGGKWFDYLLSEHTRGNNLFAVLNLKWCTEMPQIIHSFKIEGLHKPNFTF